MLPLSTTQVTESMLDGTLEAEVTVPTEAQERLAARYAVAKERLVAYWLLAACASVMEEPEAPASEIVLGGFSQGGAMSSTRACCESRRGVEARARRASPVGAA